MSLRTDWLCLLDIDSRWLDTDSLLLGVIA